MLGACCARITQVHQWDDEGALLGTAATSQMSIFERTSLLGELADAVI
jgi:hypothetical protein